MPHPMHVAFSSYGFRGSSKVCFLGVRVSVEQNPLSQTEDQQAGVTLLSRASLPKLEEGSDGRIHGSVALVSTAVWSLASGHDG